MNVKSRIIFSITALMFAVCLLSSRMQAAPVKAASPPILGANIIPNSDFEAWTGNTPDQWTVEANGGTCVSDDSVLLHGTRSVKLHIPKGKATIAVKSKVMSVSAGDRYYIRFAYRGEGLSSTQSYAGVQMCVYLIWKNESGSFYRFDYVDFSYFPMEWGYRDRIYTAPTGATQLCAVASLEGEQNSSAESTAWFDDIAICRYSPPTASDKVVKKWSVSVGKELLKVPDAPSWFYLAGTDGDETAQGARMRDAESTLGAALHTPHQAAAGYVYLSQYTLEQPLGLYRAYIRLKIPPGLKLAPGKQAADIDITSSDSGTRGALSIFPSDFTKPGTYQDFWFDFTKRSNGWIAIRVMTPGGDSEFYLDHVRVVQLKRFQDNDLLAWYPGTSGMLGSSPSLESHAGQTRVLLVNGLLADRLHLDKALSAISNCTVTSLPYKVSQDGGTITGFPTQWSDLRQYDAVIFCNTAPGALGSDQRYMLSQFVKLGGGLMLFGGKAAFGAGGIAGSFIDDILPVKVSSSQADVTIATTPLKISSSLFGKLSENLIAPYVNRATLRPGAEEILGYTDMPVMAVGNSGKGRIACFMGAPYGGDTSTAKFYANSDEWPGFLTKVIQWLTGGGAAK